jgi:hypothetical protein
MKRRDYNENSGSLPYFEWWLQERNRAFILPIEVAKKRCQDVVDEWGARRRRALSKLIRMEEMRRGDNVHSKSTAA